jgi:hypothetical protein
MKLQTHRCVWMALVALVVALVPAMARADVTKIQISSRQDVLAGKSFGNVGPYEKLRGKVYFAVDPKDPRNTIIADLDKAPKNSQGKVEFSADVFILKPKDSSKGNGVLFFDVVNRGNMAVLRTFNRAASSGDPATEAEFGDGLLMREGYTLVALGWEFDAPKRLISMDAPVATDNGKPLTGWISPWFIPNGFVPAYEYVTGYNTRAYPPLDLKSAAYRLTEREGMMGVPRLIPREDWQFAKVVDGKVVADPNWVWVKNGLKAGQTYQLTYESKDPPVAGLGFAGIRDLASFLKNDPNAIAPGRYAYTYGSSQTGRYQRQLVYEGFTVDVHGQKAIDALFIQTGGSSLGSFNERFALPNELGSFDQTKFPILYRTTTDPVTGKQDGLGARIPAGLEPKLFLVDTASEYWDRGRVAALKHTSIDGREDDEDAPNVRVFFLSAAQHGAGSFPPPETGAELKGNPNDYRWAQRALLAGLDAWVRNGMEPPASKHPRLKDGTLVHRDYIKFPAIPGIKWPTNVAGGYRVDVPGPMSQLPFLVPQVDADGIDIAGIRLPEEAVPLSTDTGWAFRGEKMGAPDTLIAMIGSYIPLPVTRADRQRTHDPRLSIMERYPSRAEYLRRVQEAANTLVQDRYVLQQDVAGIVEHAGIHWDFAVAGVKPR